MGNDSSTSSGGGGVGFSVSISASPPEGKQANSARPLAADDNLPVTHAHSYKEDLPNDVAVQDVCSAILGGLTADDIRYHWLSDHDPGPRNRQDIEALLLKLTSRYSKLYKSSLQTAFRNYANCKAILSNWQQEKEVIEGKLKRIHVVVSEKHERLSEESQSAITAELVELLGLSGPDAEMELDAFAVMYTVSLGPKLLVRLIGQERQVYLNEVAREARTKLATD